MRFKAPVRFISIPFLLILFLQPVSAVDPVSLHESIVQSLDAGDYAGASRMLKQMSLEHSARYKTFPYALLHAKVSLLAKDRKQAFQIYSALSEDPRFSKFAILPAARIAAELQNIPQAILFYQRYLRISGIPDLIVVAREAANLCISSGNSSGLQSTAAILQRNRSTRRLGQYYSAKALLMKKQDSSARTLLLSLISGGTKDDVSALALTDLDSMDGTRLSDSEKKSRGKLAYDVWNFELVKKYLAPLTPSSMEASYYYARALAFLGERASAKNTFQAAIAKWPQDSLATVSKYQYAAVFLKEGNYPRAGELFLELSRNASGWIREESAFKAAYVLRAQSRFADAIAVIEPHTSSKNQSTRGEALLLRARIFYQMGRYNEAYATLDQVSHLKTFQKSKEVLLWKGMVLEKNQKITEAANIYSSLANSYDFYSHLARERMAPVKVIREPSASSSYRLCRLPDRNREAEILHRMFAGDLMPSFLYLHLYEEASLLLPGVSLETWKLLGIDSKDRAQRYLGIVHLAGLGGNFVTATYYAEIFLKTLPSEFSLFSLNDEVLKVLFPWPYRDEIVRFAQKAQVDPFVVLAIMRQESKFKRFARSQSFARGLMQLIPSTAERLAAELGYEKFSPEQLYHAETNIHLGSQYVRQLIDEFGPGVERIAAGYNGGESNVRRWLAVSFQKEPVDFFSSIDMSETKQYVSIVRNNYELYKRIYGKETVVATAAGQ